MGLFEKRAKQESSSPGKDETDVGSADDVIREEIDGRSSVSFHCGELGVDPALVAAGHEPNGYFWESVLRFLDPALADSVELDSEAGMFAAYGDASQCDRVRDLLSPLLSDPDAITQLIVRAEAAGHEFYD